ncbi:MAG TPA: ATP synthase F1 subunit epsilon [Dictyoglomaceae bacterium]|mgnify:CR=1 FL=1|nr:ATP synthase F1 subunit epsilon [Dictyoglomaceae bacterium]
MKEQDKKIFLEINTPTKALYTGFVISIILPVEDGMIGVLPGHVNLLARIVPGILLAKTENKNLIFVIGEGFAELINDNLYIIADFAELAENIDKTTLEKEEEEIKEKLLIEKDSVLKEELRLSLSINYLKQKAVRLLENSKNSTNPQK